MGTQLYEKTEKARFTTLTHASGKNNSRRKLLQTLFFWMQKEPSSEGNPTRTKNWKQQQRTTVKRVRVKDHQKGPPAPNTRVKTS
jgi:hypothetical protein